MTSPVRRRHRDPDPAVAARLQAISYADPYVFVHANDVMEVESPALEDYPAVVERVGGWVPETAPAEARQPAAAGSEPPFQRPGPLWLESLRERLQPLRSGFAGLVVLGLVAVAVAAVA